MIRFYVLPEVEYTHQGTDPDGQPLSTLMLTPKYLHAMGIGYQSRPYGREGVRLVGCEVTPAQHTTLAANSDVIAIPTNLDNTITAGALPAVQSALEVFRLPAGWVTTSHTYRQVVSVVGKVCAIVQRFRGRHRRAFFLDDLTLAARMNQLTQANRDAIADTAVSLGLNTSTITATTTVRAALKILSDQMPPFTLAGETF